MEEGWRFPADVKGWLSEEEGACLAFLARGKRVLEIGSYEGKSAISMGQVAQSIELIDPLDGRATGGHDKDVSATLLANLRAYGVRARVHAGTTAEIAPLLRPSSFDLVYIDGDHSPAAVAVDIEAAMSLCADGGVIAFHDYLSPRDPAVTVAVNGLLARGADLVAQRGSVIALCVKGKKSVQKPLVALGAPLRGDQMAFGASRGYYLWPTGGAVKVVRTHSFCSVLDHAFNRLWAEALNLRELGATHAALIHSDVCPAQGWLDVLYREMTVCSADIISAVVPIKGPEGTTSTAVETEDPWFPRRLTMTEVHVLPETFGDEDVKGELLLNTGLWLADLRGDWLLGRPPIFQTLSRLVKDDAGKWVAQVRSEDWEFSRAARRKGARQFATRSVPLYHLGEQEFPNHHPWGLWETDRAFIDRLAREAEKGEKPCTA